MELIGFPLKCYDVEFWGYKNRIWYMISFTLTVWHLQVNLYDLLYYYINRNIYLILMLQKLN